TEAMVEMAAAAVEQIAPGAALPIVLCLPEPRPGLPAERSGRVAAGLQARLPGSQVTASGGGGHAGFGPALHQCESFLSRYPDLAVAVVAVDSYLSPDCIKWLDGQRQLHASYN